MALVKTAVNINFAQGINQKTDPFQIPLGQFENLENMVFTKGGLLEKRDGFEQLPSLPDTSYKFLTTFGDGLLAVGENLAAYSSGSETWNQKGTIQPLELSTLPIIRSATNQTYADIAVSDSGLICTAYVDNDGTNNTFKFTINDLVGENVISPTSLIPSPSGNVTGSPKVYVLGGYFVIVFTVLEGATPHLQYNAISLTNPSAPVIVANISSLYTPATTVAFDCVVVNNSMYIGWSGSGGDIRMTRIDATLVQHSTISFAGKTATVMNLCADISGNTPIIWASFYTASVGYTLAINQNLSTILAPTQFISSGTVANIAASANAGLLTVLYEIVSGNGNYIKQNTVTQAGVVGTASVLVRSVGLASKVFYIGPSTYFMGAYESTNQSTYFLFNSSGQVIARLAYANGGGYCETGLPDVSVIGTTAYIAYLYADSIQAVNKSQGVVSPNGVYAQTGVNLVGFNIGAQSFSTAEIGGVLNLSGGIVYSYDGVSPTEQNFLLYPDTISLVPATTGGFLADQVYYYQAIYSAVDASGNIARSGVSIPVTVTTTGGGTSSVSVQIPTLRLTYKNTVKIELYRWSSGQQSYFELTSILSPTLNNSTVDYITYVDTQIDADIIGNALLYTTGGVVEDAASPSTSIMTIFDTRVWTVNAENPNELWFSKQVIQNTPVEFSQLSTLYVDPNISAQASTGPVTALATMDTNLIVFKKDSCFYMNGIGPDNTDANSAYSPFTFIASTVGCTNPSSIVMIPSGLLFQSDKGIWLLNRSLQTSYIGASVEDFTTNANVVSARAISGTNYVLFALDSGITLMYDYFWNQWGTFTGIPCISATLYQGQYSFINKYGQVFKASPGKYLDGSSPTVMSLTTGWLNPAGVQGYQRAYFFELLGTYFSPHKLLVQIAYDYAPPSQQVIISPRNYNAPWGGDPLWGQSTPWGGTPALEEWKVNLQQQLCSAFQITITEMFDSTYGVQAGAGLTLSSINLVLGMKKGYRPTIAPANTTG